MTAPTRLFDCLEVQAQRPVADFLNAKENGAWRTYSTEEFRKLAYSLCNGLLKAGISGGNMTTEGRDKVAIVCSSRPQWLAVDIAVQMTGAILVPLYPTTSELELTEIFNEAEVKIVFAENADICTKLQSISQVIPSLKNIYTIEKVNGVPHWEELLLQLSAQDTQQIETVKAGIATDDVATIIYTSGTTGHPKGVMLTHKNIISNVLDTRDVLEEIELPKRRALSFLPLNHIFEKMVTYVYLFNGFSIYYAQSMETIGADLKETQPYIFCSVPRLLEKVYERIMNTGQQLTGIKRKLFFWAVGLGQRYEINTRLSWWYRFQLFLANKIIFNKWRAAIGGNVKAIVIGGAACQPRLARIFTAAGITIMEGYGLTETSPVIAVNGFPQHKRMFGTVGPVLPHVTVRIEEDGEISCKGDNVMLGYYKHPEQTAEVIQDGWFHTGDIGELINGTFLKITDRKKEIFKTSGGKYIAPQPIENKMKEDPLIEQIMVVGPGRKFAAALIVPSFPNLKKWCEQNNVPFQSNEQAIAHSAVIARFQSIIDKYNPQFNHVEQIKKFKLLSAEWTSDTGELTPKLSLKRKVILQKFEQEIEEIYIEAENQH